ncbi:hypothetical protein PInf_019175 [Phytophthora infestans]|nr:hypothetical protein PInf_019175 [Phytophthora infestans]
MFSNNKIFGLCIAVVALSSGAHAEKQVAETFGLLDASGVDNGVGVPGVASVGVGGPSYFFSCDVLDNDFTRHIVH